MKRFLTLVLAIIMVLAMLTAASAATGNSDRRKVQVTIPAELITRLASDGIELTGVRLQRRDANSTVIANFDTDPTTVTIEIGQNELLFYMYYVTSESQYYDGLWFETDKLIAAANGNEVVDIGFTDALYNFNSAVYFNGNYRATVKWVSSSSGSGSASNGPSESSGGSVPSGSSSGKIPMEYFPSGAIAFTVQDEVPANLRSVKVDMETVDPKDYTVVAGSCVVTLKESYIKTLQKGDYILSMEFADKTVSTTFEVKAVEQVSTPDPEPTPPSSNSNYNPNTGR